MKALILISITALAISVSQAQDKSEVRNDLNQLRTTYEKIQSFKVDITYSEYNAYVGGNRISFHQGHMARNKDNYRIELPGQKTIANSEVVVVKNDEEKLVLITRNDHSYKSPVMDIDLGKVLDYTNSYKPLLNLDAGYKGYKFEFINSTYQFLDLIFNEQTGLIHKIIVYGKSMDEDGKSVEGRLEILYTNMNSSPNLNSSDFSVSGIVIKKDNEYQLNGSLASYRLIDQTH